MGWTKDPAAVELLRHNLVRSWKAVQRIQEGKAKLITRVQVRGGWDDLLTFVKLKRAFAGTTPGTLGGVDIAKVMRILEKRGGRVRITVRAC